MLIPANYVNGIIILPESQILATRYTITQSPLFVNNKLNDYEATFQCSVYRNGSELQRLTKEVKTVLGINLFNPSVLNSIQLLKFGTFPGPHARSSITLYFLRVVNTITIKVRKNYEIRTLSFKKAFNEMLCPLTNGYYDKPKTLPEYTCVAECVLQRIHSYGGIMKCIKDSS